MTDGMTKIANSAFKRFALAIKDKHGSLLSKEIEGVVGNFDTSQLLKDIQSAQQTIKLLMFMGKYDIVEALIEIYFVFPEQTMRKGAIENRVQKYAMDNEIYGRTVYRKLSEARTICLKFMGKKGIILE